MQKMIVAAPRAKALSVAAAMLALTTATGVAQGEQSASASAIPMPASAQGLAFTPTSPAGWNARTPVGQAKVINAALPLDAAALEIAQPFLITGSETDLKKALLCLTQAVYYEAGFEPIQGRRAVAQVILNRVRHPAFPKSVCGVVYQGEGSATCQFSFVCNGDLDRLPARRAWDEAERVARAALSGYVEPAVGEATHYHADYVAPQWAPLLAKVAMIGHHIFYRWPGAWGSARAFTGAYQGEDREPAAMHAALPGTISRMVGVNGAIDTTEVAKSRVAYHLAVLLDAKVSGPQVRNPDEAVITAGPSDAPATVKTLEAATIASGK